MSTRCIRIRSNDATDRMMTGLEPADAAPTALKRLLKYRDLFIQQVLRRHGRKADEVLARFTVDRDVAGRGGTPELADAALATGRARGRRPCRRASARHGRRFRRRQSAARR